MLGKNGKRPRNKHVPIPKDLENSDDFQWGKTDLKRKPKKREEIRDA